MNYVHQQWDGRIKLKSKKFKISLNFCIKCKHVQINEKLNNRYIKVLIENEIIDQNKLFGRNQYLNSVIVEGNKDNIGSLIDVHIESFNRNTLFGKQKKYKTKAA